MAAIPLGPGREHTVDVTGAGGKPVDSAGGARTGVIRGDVVPDELASYCLHALGAAAAAPEAPDAAGVDRLVRIVLGAITDRM